LWHYALLDYVRTPGTMNSGERLQCAIVVVVILGVVPTTTAAEAPSPRACQQAVHTAGAVLVKQRLRTLAACGGRVLKGSAKRRARCVKQPRARLAPGKAAKLQRLCSGVILSELFRVCGERGPECGGDAERTRDVVRCLECNMWAEADCLYALTFAPTMLPDGCGGQGAFRLSP
jgi:hypothetical protein